MRTTGSLTSRSNQQAGSDDASQRHHAEMTGLETSLDPAGGVNELRVSFVCRSTDRLGDICSCLDVCHIVDESRSHARHEQWERSISMARQWDSYLSSRMGALYVGSTAAGCLYSASISASTRISTSSSTSTSPSTCRDPFHKFAHQSGRVSYDVQIR